MNLFDFLKGKMQSKQKKKKINLAGKYIKCDSITPDEKPFYQPDEYYTLESYPETLLSQKVVTFEERKKTTFPSSNGLYIGEIMLLEYCNKGTYPKPKNGYPGFWWFKYGIRDIGHALESLEKRGFIRWGNKFELLTGLKIKDLKSIASSFNIKVNQSKENLINEIKNNIIEKDLPDEFFSNKYVLTELGQKELKENEYVVYMHKNKYKTRDDVPENLSFTVWDVNRLIHNNKSNWRKIVADLEQKRIGSRFADKEIDKKSKDIINNISYTREEIWNYIQSIIPEVKELAKKKGDGYSEELEGLSYKSIDDKKALYYFYISIEKKFDAPAVYKETAKILRKYKLYEEELRIIELGLLNINSNSSNKVLLEREKKLKELCK